MVKRRDTISYITAKKCKNARNQFIWRSFQNVENFMKESKLNDDAINELRGKIGRRKIN